MAFTWNEILIGDIEDTDINEIKDNINSLANTFGISGLMVWRDNISDSQLVLKTTLEDIQNNIDKLDDNKICLGYTPERFTGNDGDHNSGNDTDNDDTVLDTNYIDNDSSEYGNNNGYDKHTFAAYYHEKTNNESSNDFMYDSNDLDRYYTVFYEDDKNNNNTLVY